MASPFPGMDPYLERHWGDVHQRMITYACDSLQTHLPTDLRARMEERVFIESPEGAERNMYPDIRVVERGRGKAGPPPSNSGVAVAEPVIIHLPDEPVTEGFIEIINVGSGKRVVTVLEVLSLSNKQPGKGQDLYLQKQRQMRGAGVSFVEIDLLRSGNRVVLAPPDSIPQSLRTTYQASVRRGWRPEEVEVYPLSLRARLPAINVPLRQEDPDVVLDLQALLEQCYRNGGYDDDIDYKQDPHPPLEPADAAWADELLRSQGKR